VSAASTGLLWCCPALLTLALEGGERLPGRMFEPPRQKVVRNCKQLYDEDRLNLYRVIEKDGRDLKPL